MLIIKKKIFIFVENLTSGELGNIGIKRQNTEY
jgi:hypothetical protein